MILFLLFYNQMLQSKGQLLENCIHFINHNCGISMKMNMKVPYRNELLVHRYRKIIQAKFIKQNKYHWNICSC